MKKTTKTTKTAEPSIAALRNAREALREVTGSAGRTTSQGHVTKVVRRVGPLAIECVELLGRAEVDVYLDTPGPRDCACLAHTIALRFDPSIDLWATLIRRALRAARRRLDAGSKAIAATNLAPPAR